MKRITLAVAAMLIAGSAGVAFATPVNLINNGDFSSVSFGPGESGPTQFGKSGSSCGIPPAPATSRKWGGQFIQGGWNGDTPTQGNDPYQIWYENAAAATGTQACTQYNNTGNQYLPGPNANTSTGVLDPSGAGSFVGLDGQKGVQGGVSQYVAGLTAGTYTLTFDWATTQEMSRVGATWDYLAVDFNGNLLLDTQTNQIPEHGFSGWSTVSKSFYVNGPGTLSFLSFGGQIVCGIPGSKDYNLIHGPISDCQDPLTLTFDQSSGVPPFALLANVTLTHNVPEPPELAMFGLGLLGLGFLTVFARNRALRRKDEDGEGNIA